MSSPATQLNVSRSSIIDHRSAPVLQKTLTSLTGGMWPCLNIGTAKEKEKKYASPTVRTYMQRRNTMNSTESAAPELSRPHPIAPSGEASPATISCPSQWLGFKAAVRAQTLFRLQLWLQLNYMFDKNSSLTTTDIRYPPTPSQRDYR